ncbi:MAG: ATP-grasp domain-containing protein [Bacteroidota bacterium]
MKASSTKPRILVLDGDHKNALAIIRHLGKTGHYTIETIAYSQASIALFSKYNSKKIIVSHPKKNPDQFIVDLLEVLKNGNYTVVLPVSYICYQLCSVHKAAIQKYTSLTIAHPEHIYLASSKVKTYQLAEDLNIPYPKVTPLANAEEINKVETTYPCVIKAPHEAGKNIVEYANNKAELVQKFNRICSKNDFDGALPIIQKFIVGEGAGFFAFYKDGKCKNFFIHRRIREYPVTGGASTVAEGYYDANIEKNGKKILDHLNWEGVAMVEFKKDNSTGEYNLMEINAKFWGSLDLALSCGVNFPQMLIDDALGKEITKNGEYGRHKFQWILNGDLLHVLERPSALFRFMKDLFTAKNDFEWSDIKPNLFQIANIPVHYYKKWFK